MKTWYNGNQEDDDMNIISTQKEQLAQKLFDIQFMRNKED